MNLSELTSKIIAFRDARDWKQFHKPNHLAAAIAIEAAELQEHFLWKSVSEVQAKISNQAERIAVADELADVLIFSLLFLHQQSTTLVPYGRLRKPTEGIPHSTTCRAEASAEAGQPSTKPPLKRLAGAATLIYDDLSVIEQKKSTATGQGRCAGAEVCPLSRVPVGSTVCIKALAASPEIRARLRALGLEEKQELKLLSRESNF